MLAAASVQEEAGAVGTSATIIARRTVVSLERAPETIAGGSSLTVQTRPSRRSVTVGADAISARRSCSSDSSRLALSR
jgi:hypothetical protein